MSVRLRTPPPPSLAWQHLNSEQSQASCGEIRDGSGPASWPLTWGDTHCTSRGNSSYFCPPHRPPGLAVRCFPLDRLSEYWVFIVVMFVCSVSEHNKYPARHKETGAGLYPVLPTDCLRKHSPSHNKQKQYLFFQGKFSPCWCSDEYRAEKQILIDCKSQARHRGAQLQLV